MTIGEKIRQTRKEKGMTQKQLGDRCGMPDSQIRQYESGKIIPKIATLRRIADAVECDVSELVETESFLGNTDTDQIEKPILTTGEKIRNVRKQKEMTQKELGDILGVSPQMIAQYEKGKRIPKMETLMRIADALSVKIHALANWQQYDTKDIIEDLTTPSPVSLTKDLYVKKEESQYNDDLLKLIDSLNDKAKERIITYVRELTLISQYRKESDKT